MAFEVEIKLALQAGDKEKFCAHPRIRSAAAKGSKQVISTYYDTPDFQLRKKKIGFRVRRNGDLWVQTVKGEGQQMGGLSTRSEHEVPIAGDSPEMDRLSGSPFETLIQSVGDHLKPAFVTDFMRTKWILNQGQSQVEVVLDEGLVHNAEKQLSLLEIELELLNGNTSDLLNIACSLAADIDFVPEPLSKAARGYALGGGSFAVEQPVDLEPGDINMIVRPFLTNLQAILILVRRDEASTGLARATADLKILGEAAALAGGSFWLEISATASSLAQAITENQLNPVFWGRVTRLQLALLRFIHKA